MNAALAPIRDAKTILLTTYKRDGTAVATPVSVAFDPRVRPSAPALRCSTASRRAWPLGRSRAPTASCRPSWCRRLTV